LAVASIYARSPTLLDRISNALSKEAAVKVIGDCERIVRTGQGGDKAVHGEEE